MKYLIKTSEVIVINRVIITTQFEENELKKLTYKPTHATLCMCKQSFIPVDESKLVMLIRAYGGCLGTKSR